MEFGKYNATPLTLNDGDVLRDMQVDNRGRLVFSSGTGANAAQTQPASTSSATTRSVTASATSVALLPASANRIRDTVVNDSAATLYILEGSGTASATNYTFVIAPKTTQPGYYEATDWKGAVQGIWSSVDGAARITERT